MRKIFPFVFLPCWVSFLFASCTFDSAGLPGSPIIDPSCSDGTRNGDETDTDCGGPDCAPCANGKTCRENGDCSSRICSDDLRCIPPATCTDGTRNGDETDTDCGGPDCDPCAVNLMCLENRDCSTGFCSDAGFCTEPTCEDGKRNGSETDTDCGGPDCAPCTAGRACTENSDCASGVCNEVCLAPSCSDHVRNGSETDTDCGGPDCASCANGSHCQNASDCASFVCSDGVCLAPSCEDLTWNQYETDIDCGGPYCPPCPLEKQCISDDDCASHYCNNNFCAAITSCKHLVSLFPDSPSGWYYITPETTTVQAFCYIVPPTVYTFYYVSGGPATSKTTDSDGCSQAGMMLFTPISSSHYTIARDLALSWGIDPNGNFLGPLGIYNPHDGINDNVSLEKWCGVFVKNCCEKKMIGGGGDDTVSRSGCGFTSLAGSQFWASEKTDIGEPNGDYTATCWLKFYYDANGNVDSWNDNKCTYSYSNYMCMALDDRP